MSIKNEYIVPFTSGQDWLQDNIQHYNKQPYENNFDPYIMRTFPDNVKRMFVTGHRYIRICENNDENNKAREAELNRQRNMTPCQWIEENNQMFWDSFLDRETQACLLKTARGALTAFTIVMAARGIYHSFVPIAPTRTSDLSRLGAVFPKIPHSAPTNQTTLSAMPSAIAVPEVVIPRVGIMVPGGAPIMPPVITTPPEIKPPEHLPFDFHYHPDPDQLPEGCRPADVYFDPYIDKVKIEPVYDWDAVV
jgi:hypothetical protein